MNVKKSAKGWRFILSTVAAFGFCLGGVRGLHLAAQALMIEGSTNSTELLNSLQSGGHVIYFRHGAAVRNVRPEAVSLLPNQFQACLDPGRPLSAEGVADMQNVGEFFNQLNIPVGRVLVSPSCRTIETGWYAFDEDVTTIEVTEGLNGIPDSANYDPRGLWINLRDMLQVVPSEGTNTVLSAHSTNIKFLTGINIAEGEAVVFRPDGEGNFNLVARIKQDEWLMLGN